MKGEGINAHITFHISEMYMYLDNK